MVSGTEDEVAFDIFALRKELGAYSFDPGFANTAEGRSAITYIDGAGGVLRYRGYPIEELAAESSFIETAYLLVYGELPSAIDLEKFENDIARESALADDLKAMLELFPSKAHPMQMLAAVVGSLRSFHDGNESSADPDFIEAATRKLIGQVLTMIAWISRVRSGRPAAVSDPDPDYVRRFLRNVFSDTTDYEPKPVVSQALNTLLILHADHGQNCSTTALASSALAEATSTRP